MAGRSSFGSVRAIPGTNPVRYQARYSHQGQRYNGPVRFTTKRDADAFLARTQTEISKGIWQAPGHPTDPAAPTFADYAAVWLAERKLRPGTRVTYARWLKNLLPVFGPIALTDITLAQVRTWHAADLKRGTDTQTPHNYQMLAAILATAVEDEIIVKTPCRIKGAGKVRRAKEPDTITKDEVLLLAETVPPRYKALMLLTAFCALRSGEVTALTRADLDMTNCQVRIVRSLNWPDYVPEFGPPKTEAGRRVVTFPTWLKPALAEHLLSEYCQQGPDGLLFPAAHAGPTPEASNGMPHSSIYKVLKKARQEIGHPDLTMHGLRHSGLTLFAGVPGTNTYDLMSRGGHSTPAQAMNYQHAVEGKQRRLADGM